MNDRELLELAALAAGVEYPKWNEAHGYMMSGIGSDTREWNPLSDNGDAFRVAETLRLSICHHHADNKPVVTVMVGIEWHSRFLEVHEPHGQDAAAATRRAIVRAAAEIAKDRGEQP